MKARPTLGYSSRTMAVQTMLAKGRTREEIAGVLDATPSRVGSIIHGAARGVPVETVKIPREILDALKPHADARDMSRHELVRQILRTIAADNMADAILDDGKASE